MITTKILFGIFSTSISLLAENFIYGSFCKSKVNISTFKYFILFFTFSILIYLNNVYNVNGATFIIQIILMILFNKFTYNEELVSATIKTFVIFFLIALFEVVLSIFLIIGDFINLDHINQNYLLKLIFSITDLTLVYLSIVLFNKFFLKIYNLLLKKSPIITKILCFLSILLMGLIGYNISRDYSGFETYISNVLILLVFILVVILLLREIILRRRDINKQTVLLENMSKYEELIDSQRIFRHELLNNLLTLKSIQNKNSKSFEVALNDLILQNEKSEFSGLTSLYNLPSGLKGMLYYKIHEMKKCDIEVTVNVDRNTITIFDNLKSNYYIEISRMIGILLDNAREAAKSSKRKQVTIDIYKTEEELIIYIENTFRGKVDFEKIYTKNYSSKGTNRGIGLYVIKSIVDKSNCYEMKQEVNNCKNFVTKLKINKEKVSKK